MNNKNFRAKIFAGLVAIIGLINIASALLMIDSKRIHMIRHILTPEITLSSRSLTLLIGFLLISIAWHLALRKQIAFLITTWLLAFSILFNVLKGLDIEEAVIAFLALAALSWFREDFTAKSDPGKISDIFFSIPYAILFFFTYGILGFYLLRHHFTAPFDINLVLTDIVRLATFQGEAAYLPKNHEARWFLESITMIPGAAVMYIFFSLTSPVMKTTPVNRRDRTAVENIVKTKGTSSIAYFALGNDKSYFFSEETDCVIPYVLKTNVALAAGDPIGTDTDIPATITAYAKLADENSWVPAFYYAREEYRQAYEKARFSVLKIGEEALIDVQTFDTKGKARQDLRSAMNKAEREQWKFHLYEGPITDENITAQIKTISESWLAEKSGGEMGFTMGGTNPEGDTNTLVTAASDSSGRIFAFMTWSPMYKAEGWSGDYMRRAEDAPNGAMEFLITSTIRTLKEKGVKTLSLGLAPLANVHDENPEAILSVERGIEIIYQRFDKAYNFKSLHHFKQKFAPKWENRYLVYPGLSVLPRVIYALVSVQVPELTMTEIIKILNRNPNQKTNNHQEPQKKEPTTEKQTENQENTPHKETQNKNPNKTKTENNP